MDKLIRNKHIGSYKRNQDGSIKLWLAIVFALIASAGTAWIGRSYGFEIFLLLVGVSIVSILLIGVLRLTQNSTMAPLELGQFDARTIASSIMAINSPILIMRDGNPFIANPAYFELARSLGVDTFSDVPPAIDQLFKLKEKTVSAALYRLHHTTGDNEVSEENIRIMSHEGMYRSFNIHVCSIEFGQLWQIFDASDGPTENDVMLSEAPVGLLSARADGSIIQMNRALQSWLGIEAGDKLENLNSYIQDAADLLGGSQKPGRTIRTDTKLITTKGVVSPAVLTASWQEMDSGDRYVSVALYGHTGLGLRAADLGEMAADSQKDAAKLVSEEVVPEQAAEPSEAKMLTLGNAPFGVVRLDNTDLRLAKIIAANESILSMSNKDALIGQDFSDLFSQDEDWKKFIKTGSELPSTPRDIYLKASQPVPVSVYFSTDADQGCTAYIIDISMRKELEGQLVQSQKMQAIGMLVANIAHDFNNLLTVIRGHTDQLLVRHPVGDPSYPDLQMINQNVARAAGQVNKLLIFSFQKTLRKQVLAVSETLSDASLMLRPAVGERIRLEIIHGRSLPNILVDKEQLETVLMNLCVNARDAMKDKSSGTITVRSSLAKPENLRQDNVEAEAGEGFVILEITDEGSGMDEQTQAKIFEPFFTTKGQGQGTGLGLATVYGIVKQSGGHLRVKSELGTGTSFRIYIPSTDKKIEPPKSKTVKPADLSGQGRILFVDDEPALRPLAANSLRKRGYTVIEAVDGEDAYEILQSGEFTFDLMVSDVVMPGLDGPELLKKGRELLGDARVVFISGYAEEQFSDLLEDEPDVSFLPKPFSLKQLAEKVKAEIGDAH